MSTGLADHGWNYVNIDDGWELPQRDKEGNVLVNEKFKDMKKLADYVHSKGFKLGIYSSPGGTTCGGFLGSYQHEELDARTYAEWGIDYLKYDWCSYGSIFGQIAPSRENRVTEFKRPYFVMRDALQKQNRDIVFSLCQYGFGEVYKWGDEVGGQLWRTTGDIEDKWESLEKIGFGQEDCAPYSKPGNWNDPDMLIVGWVGWGPNLHPTRLLPDEQYLHISMWALLSAPLLIGCDLTKLDDFTLNLLTNDEVIDIDQDLLGKAARVIYKDENIQIWAKDLEDGSKAVGIFNRAGIPCKGSVSWEKLGVKGKQIVRDVWRQIDLCAFEKSFESESPAHGVVLVKIKKDLTAR